MASSFQSVVLKPSRITLLSFGLLLVLTACDRKDAAMTPAANDNSAPAVETTAENSASSATDSQLLASNIVQQVENSPFASSADPALKETYGRALAAFDKGDYGTAWAELLKLNRAEPLSVEQSQAIADLAKKIRDANETGSSATYSLAGPEEDPFSTADPSVAERFSAAKLAIQIGAYDRAQGELTSLSTNAQLNWHQKYVVRDLLAQTEQAIAGGQ